MIIRPIASGSSGNCYYVSDGITELLLDCGIPIKRICEALWDMGTRLSNIEGCFVTHSHGDHVKAAQKLANAGVDELDGVTGATYSANATQQNIAAALDYYTKNAKNNKGNSKGKRKK